MCGISGILGIEDKEKAYGIIARMNKALAHRGPNDEGVYIDKGVALGHRRLSIIDLSKNGHQPMVTADGRFTIAYNGELYNFKALKMELQRATSEIQHSTLNIQYAAYTFNTQSDTEVILAAYQRWGIDCLQHFNGMFAFAIWDKEKQELFIARDRLGIKPLYYWQSDSSSPDSSGGLGKVNLIGSVFAFASELRTLLQTNLFPRKIDYASLNDYVSFQTVHAPHTIIENVKMLLPGHYLLLKKENSASSAIPTRYWSPLDIPERKPSKPYNDICTDVRELLFSAVEMRLVSDVPFGAFLSGGIDSSIVVAIMAKVMNRKVQTFSVSFNEGAFNEAPYAQQIAQQYGTEHHDIRLSPKTCLDKLPQALSCIDHPGGDGINSYIVAEATKEAGITMTLSGLGGDELFAGYPLFKRLYRLEKIKRLAPILKLLVTMPINGINLIKSTPATAKLAELCALPNWNLDQTYHLARETFSKKETAALLTYKTSLERSSEFNSEQGLLSQITTTELNHYLPDILLRDTDQFSMAHALEVRVPFLDYKLVEYVLSLGDASKYPHAPKKLLTDAVAGLLPEAIIHRKKMGFTLPWSQWMKEDLRTFCEKKIKSLAERDSFNRDKILALWNSFINNRPKTPWYKIWHLAVLENWLERNDVEC